MSKHAVILAGGKGTRLRPYTVVLPKPLMPIGEYPILEVIVRQLSHYGFEKITFAVNHQAELIKAFFQDGSKWGIDIEYSLEKDPLGTMGPLANIDSLPDDFLVMNGDVLTDINFAELLDDHVSKASLFSISSKERCHRIDYGVLDVNADYELTGFREKPEMLYNVSMGVYVVNKSIVEKYVPEGESFGFDDLVLKMLELGDRVDTIPFNGYWLDIGRPDDYMQAIEEFEELKSGFLHE